MARAIHAGRVVHARICFRKTENRADYSATILEKDGDLWNQRTLLFTEDDIVNIQEARRTCRSNSSHPAKAGVDTGASVAPSKADISTRVQAFHHKPARRKSA